MRLLTSYIVEDRLIALARISVIRGFWSPLFLLIVIFFTLGCERKIPENAVARVGNTIVSTYEFLHTYTDLMLYTNQMDSPETRRKHLNKLIQRKLLAQAAREQNLHLDSLSLNLVKKAREKALLDILYRTKITTNMTEPNDSLIRLNFKWSNTEVHLRHIFSEDKSTIDSIYSYLRQYPETFEEVARSAFNNPVLAERGGDIGYIKYNQMDPAFEKAAYSLPVGSTSLSVRSSYGWHIIQKLNERSQVILTEDEYQQQKRWLKRQIIRKQQQISADKYVNEMMSSKNIHINDELFYFVANRVHNILHMNHPDQNLQYPPPYSWENQKQIRLSFGDLKYETLATFDKGQFSVEDFIDHLDQLPANILYENLVTGFYRILRDHILIQEAIDSGLFDDPEIKIRSRDAEDLYYASKYLSWYTGQRPDSTGIIHLKSSLLNQLTDSLTQQYTVKYYYEILDTLF